MTELEQYRTEIDAIDQRILELLDKRMKISDSIAAFKSDNGLPILDAVREKKKIESIEAAADRTLEQAVEPIWKAIMEQSRIRQQACLRERPRVDSHQEPRYGLLGRKLGHTYSPYIHALFGSVPYESFEVEPDELEDFIRHGEWQGCNVTIPYKKQAAAFCDELSDSAQRLECVNTLVRRPDGSIFGENTDYCGFKYLLDSKNMDVAGRKICVLGTGGASATVQAVLADLGARKIVVFGRHDATPYSDLEAHLDAEYIVNTTPVGMYPEVPKSLIAIEPFAKCGESAPGAHDGLMGYVDLIYNPSRTAMMMEAEELGVPTANGLNMLVAQARKSSEIFQGITLSDSDVRNAIAHTKAEMENIAIIGMPGAGKTTIGRMLAERMGRPFYDTDDEITAKTGCSAAELLSTEGEDAFRALETEVLHELGRKSGCIISCGGGVVTKPENYRLLHQNSTIVRLDRNIDLLETSNRPLSERDGVQALFEKRDPLYKRWADVDISNNATKEEVVEGALTALDRRIHIGNNGMKMRIKIINGPNINMLGIREPGIYGTETYNDLLALIDETARSTGVTCDCMQTNSEGRLIDEIQACRGCYDAVIINPGGYTHTSIAIADALSAISIPYVEVHISDVQRREPFRQISYIRDHAQTTISGKGIAGYGEAIGFLAELLANEKS